ncbi:uncharacterized protein [Lolium perenne]|uniref:uncharacterized protein n=1 Tax=Lolium perenne TaxID=4522 RepID=UPI003A98D8D4
MRVVGARQLCMPVTGWSEWNYCRNMQAAQIKQGRLEDALRQHCALLGHEVEAVKLLGRGALEPWLWPSMAKRASGVDAKRIMVGHVWSARDEQVTGYRLRCFSFTPHRSPPHRNRPPQPAEKPAPPSVLLLYPLRSTAAPWATAFSSRSETQRPSPRFSARDGRYHGGEINLKLLIFRLLGCGMSDARMCYMID